MRKMMIAALGLMTVAGAAKAVEDLAVLKPLRSYNDWATTTVKTAGPTAIPFKISTSASILRILVQQDTYFSFVVSSPAGSTPVTPVASRATGFLVPASVATVIRVGGHSLISMIASSTAGAVHFTEMGK